MISSRPRLSMKNKMMQRRNTTFIAVEVAMHLSWTKHCVTLVGPVSCGLRFLYRGSSGLKALSHNIQMNERSRTKARPKMESPISPQQADQLVLYMPTSNWNNPQIAKQGEKNCVSTTMAPPPSSSLPPSSPSARNTSRGSCLGSKCFAPSTTGAFPTQPQGSFPSPKLEGTTSSSSVFGCLVPAMVTPAKNRKSGDRTSLRSVAQKLRCKSRSTVTPQQQDDWTADFLQTEDDEDDEMPLLSESEQSWSFSDSNSY